MGAQRYRYGLAGSLGLGLISFCLPVAAFLGYRAARNRLGLMWVAAASVVLCAGVVMTIGSTTRIIYGAVTAHAVANATVTGRQLNG
jgi:hypothetical protein